MVQQDVFEEVEDEIDGGLGDLGMASKYALLFLEEVRWRSLTINKGMCMRRGGYGRMEIWIEV